MSGGVASAGDSPKQPQEFANPVHDATFLRGPFWTERGGAPKCWQCLNVCPAARVPNPRCNCGLRALDRGCGRFEEIERSGRGSLGNGVSTTAKEKAAKLALGRVSGMPADGHRWLVEPKGYMDWEGSSEVGKISVQKAVQVKEKSSYRFFREQSSFSLALIDNTLAHA